jgi:hypothetical protein
MGDLEAIVLVAGYRQATVLTHEGETRVPVRQAIRLDDFAAAIAERTTARVSVVDGLQLPADLSGTALVGDHTFVRWLQAEADPEGRITPRVVWLNANRTTALPELEQGRLAGAIDVASYSAWQVSPQGPGQASLYGLTALAEPLDASCFTESDRYCQMSSPRFPGLPALLVAYLERYLPLVDGPPETRSRH